MGSITQVLNTYLLPEIRSPQPWEMQSDRFVRPIREILLDPLRSVFGGERCFPVSIIQNTIYRGYNPEYLESLTSRVIRLIIYSQIGIPTLLTFCRLQDNQKISIMVSKEPFSMSLLTAGIVYNIAQLFFAQVGYVINYHVEPILIFMLALGWPFSNLENRLMVHLGNVFLAGSLSGILHYFISKKENLAGTIILSLATAAPVFASHYVGVPLKSFIYRSIAILVGSVAVGILLKLGFWFFRSSIRNEHQTYLTSEVQENTDANIVTKKYRCMDRELKTIEMTAMQPLGEVLIADLFTLILHHCSPSGLIRLRSCNKILFQSITLNFIFNKHVNFLPKELGELKITLHPLNNALLDSIKEVVDKTKFECLPTLSSINNHLGTDHAITWGIDSNDKIFLCFQIKTLGAWCTSNSKEEHIFHLCNYILLNYNADPTLPFYKNIKVIGNWEYGIGWDLRAYLTDKEQRDYWTRMFTGKVCGRLIGQGNPPLVNEETLHFRYSLQNY